MRKNSSMIIKSIITLTIVASTLSTTAFAAWGWETPGYEWAREKRLTSIVNTSTLNKKVSHEDFYSTLIKYLNLKGVRPKKDVKQNIGSLSTYNRTVEGIVKVVQGYISKTSLTVQEYREAITYINHIYTQNKGINTGILPENANLLTRDSLKDLYLYFSLARYKAATLIDEPSYKNMVLQNLNPVGMYNVGNVKYKELVDYNIKPYYGDITRKEFLTLMFSLLSDQSLSDDEVLQQFAETGVLVGYENGALELDNPLTYAEMFTFLRRFEIFDFNSESAIEDGNTTGSDEKDVKEYN